MCNTLLDLTSGPPDRYLRLVHPLPGQLEPAAAPFIDGDNIRSWYRRYREMPDEIRPVLRTCTLRRHRRADGEIDIDFLVHDDTGPGSAWAQRARPVVEVEGPRKSRS